MTVTAKHQEGIAADIVSPSRYVHMGEIDAEFARLRREQPIAWVDREPYRPFWAVTRYADIIDVSRRHDEFLNEPRLLLLPRDIETAALKATTGGLAETLRAIAELARLSRRPLGDFVDFVRAQRASRTRGRTRRVRTLIDMDAPDHRVFRDLTQRWFMGPGVKRLEMQIEALVGSYIERMRQADGCIDFARDVAMRLPLSVIMSILGLPQEDEDFVLRVTQQLLNASDPELQKSKQYGADVVGELFAYYGDIVRARRRQPTDDLTSVLANAEMGGKPLGPVETLSYLLIVTTAGHETTAAALSGGLKAFMDFPAERQRARSDAECRRGLADEVVRWVTPVRHFCRTARVNTSVSGVPIAAGESVVLWYPSGNRDESVFVDAFQFRIDRKPNHHLGFGHGVHHCLGRMLALTELRAFFGALIPKLTMLEPAGEARPIESNFTAGFKSLPIRCRLQ